MFFGFNTIASKENGGLKELRSFKKRIIAHIDMDSFFSSCEEVCDPMLKQRPLLICGRHKRGVVVAANYLAKQYDAIHIGMSANKAQQICPEAIFLVGDLDKYIWFSQRINDIARDYSPHIEPYSIDELFLDLTGVISTDKMESYGKSLKSKIYNELKIPSTIGFGPNRYVAKMACRLGKPNGLLVLDETSYRKAYWNSPVDALWGLGPRGKTSLNRLGIETVEELARYPVEALKTIYGKRGQCYHDMAWGQDDSEVGKYNNRPNISYGHSYTLEKDSRHPDIMRAILFRLCDKCSSRMRRDGFLGKTIHVSYETEYGQWGGHQVTLEVATQSDVDIFAVCWRELQTYQLTVPIRRLAMRVSHLISSRREMELPLFDVEGEQAQQRTLSSIDLIRDKFGENSIMRASNLMGFKALKSINFQTARRFQSSIE